MKMSTIFLIFSALIIYAFVSGCGKTDFKIGHGDPKDEIQKCLKLSEDKKFTEAIDCLEVFKSKFSQTPFGAEAELAIGDNYFNQKEYLLAADTYMMYTKLHPYSPKLDYAFYRLGLSYLNATSKAIDRDQEHIGDAIFYLKTAVSSFPDSPYHEAAVASLKDARNRVAMRTYYIGNFYYKAGEYIAAIPRLIDVAQDYPETSVAPKALYKLVVATGKLRKINEAKIFFSKLTIDYPESEWTKKAEGKISKYVKKYGEGEKSQGGALAKEAPEENNDTGLE